MLIQLIQKSIAKDLQKFIDQVKEEMIMNVALDLVKITKEIAPDTESFTDAIHIDNEDGDHALIVLEDNISNVMEGNRLLIDIMRRSIEWDDEVRTDEASIAAYALVNESLEAAKELWNQQ